ncbi:MAG TPA: MFS transporter [Dehalococcoidia bacterium]|nr:MFS transporter [Dehalococcoidia bacterium]
MPRRWSPPRVFYGWWVVGACFIVALYMGGVIFYGFTAVFEPIAAEFGWSYAQISLAASLRGLEVGLLTPVVGMLVDRWGPRRLIFGGVVIGSLGLMLLSQTGSLGVFYAAFILMAIGMSCTGSTVMMTAVANWFRRRVALATGIMICGYGSGGLLVPLVVQLIDLYGWRMMVVILALGLLTVGLPLSLVVRHKPEQYGYLPDGERGQIAGGDGVSATPQTKEVDIGAREAMKGSVFWKITLGLMPKFIAVVTVVTHVMPYLSSIGVARATSGLVATAIPLLSIGGRLGFGWLGDRLDKRRLAAGALGLVALGLLCFELTPLVGAELLVPFFILFGLGYGGSLTMAGALPREYFGRTSFGTIVGFIWGIGILGTLVGPPLAGWVFDHWGSYQGVWLALAGLAIGGAVIMALLPPAGSAKS